MFRRPSSIVLVIVAMMALAAPVAAAPGPVDGDRGTATTDHLGGTFRACGRITEFTAPMVGTDGSLTVAGVVDGTAHAFVIDEAAPVSPLVPALEAAEDWTCLHLMGDGMGVLVDVAVADHTSCGPLVEAGGFFLLEPGSTDPLTTTVLDGNAAAVVAADADLAAFLAAIATVDGAAEACLEFQLAGDGTLAAILLDYALAPGGDLTAPIACGAVDGTPIAYRDPASQPYPEGTTVGVAGFTVDASLVDGPHQSVLSFHLDAGLDLCLMARIVDSVIVVVAVLTGVTNAAEVCGQLEVIGGLVFVDTVVVPQGLTAVNFAEPTPSELASACAGANAQEAIAAGHLAMCGDFEAVTDTTFTVSGITFHLEAPIDADNAPAVGGPQGILLQGPIDPYAPFGPANPATLTATPLAGCAGASPSPLPDTSAPSPVTGTTTAPVALLAALWTLSALGLATVRIRRR
jgi:hypothetical protein